MQLSDQEEPLSHRVAKGGVWVFALSGVQKLLGLIRLVILARLLAPNDFGSFGIALLIISTFETFSQPGFQLALVQKKEDIANYLDTAWTVSVIRSIVLFTILFFSAPYLGLFFDIPDASVITQVIGVSILFRGFTNIGIIYFQRELAFNKQFIYGSAGTIAYFIVGVSAAMILKNVWALVFGQLAADFIGLMASYLIHPYRPRFKLDLNKARELFGFGRWVSGSAILVFLVTQGDDAFVGKFLGVTMLAFYQMAYRISNMPATEITHVISYVTFPAYSKMQDDLPRLREAYLRVLQLTAFLSFPIAAFIFVLGPDFTSIFLGDKWTPMVPAMQVLVLAGLVRSIAATTGPLFYAIGGPQIETKWQIIRLLTIAVLIYPFTSKWGILGASITIFLSIFVSNIGFSFMAIKITKCGANKFIKVITLPLTNGIITTSIMLGLKTLVDIQFWEFITISCAGILTYLSTTYFLDKYFDYNMQTTVRQVLKSFKGI
jgi:lipopolysaccharide exporter